MKRFRFWLPSLIGLFVAPLFFLLPYTISSGADHAGAGMVQLLVLYPIPLLAMMFAPGLLAIAAVWLQFPLYGFVISYANLRQSLWLKILAGIIWLHLIAIGAFIIIFVIQTAL